MTAAHPGMQYRSWTDVDPRLRDIKPRVTLAMANEIAACAQGLEEAGNMENAWAIAQAEFRREYKVMGGRWVRRRKPLDLGEVIRRISGKWYLYTADGKKRLGGPYDTEAQAKARERQVQFFKHRGEAEGDPMKGMSPQIAKLAEDVRQWVEENKAGGVWITRAQMAELCPDCATTMERKGLDKVNVLSEAMKPHLLAGLCNKFGGSGGFFTRCAASGIPVSDKKRFCAWLHHECHGIWPGEEAAVDGPTPDAKRLAERGWWPAGDESPPYVPMGAKTFGDLEAMQAAEDASEQMHTMAYQFGRLVDNVLNDAMETPENKMLQLRIIAAEFISLAEQVMGLVGTDIEPEPPPVVEVDPKEAARAVKFGETHAGAVLAIKAVALAEGAAGSAPVPLEMDVVLIEPGWGNTRDHNYYPREVLARDAGVFAGAKMYETDHRADEKSTRTWVSTVKAIKGTTESGAPVAQVVVHDPGFAERVRALNEAKDADGQSLLRKMECSILGSGMARKGKVGGQEANIVERITEAQSVDWVTRAGAGGRALRLAESEETMDRIVTLKVSASAETDSKVLAEKLGQHAGELFGKDAKIETVTLAEATAEPAPGTTPEPKPAPTAAPAPTPAPLMEAAAVKAKVDATGLPAVSKARLATGSYANEAALEVAIAAEGAYVKALTGAGQPFGQGPSQAPGTPAVMDETTYDAEFAKIGERYGFPVAAAKKD